jgi:hypothetical protein
MSDILGEASKNYAAKGFIGSDTKGGAAIIFRDPRRKQTPTPPLKEGPVRDMGNLTPGAAPPTPPAAQEVTQQKQDTTGNVQPASGITDLRVRIRVPKTYLTTFTQGTSLAELGPSYLGGIIFPYTPQVTMEHKAEYGSLNPIHSNFPINFYKSSSVSDISITGKFTVQNEVDAIIWLATVRLLAALTKMSFGNDPTAGSPPPVCRLDAYGEYNLKNIPVVITSFKHDFPDDCDFYSLAESSKPFGAASVPTRSTLTINCKPMYSRAEMQASSVTGFINGTYKGKGYL